MKQKTMLWISTALLALLLGAGGAATASLALGGQQADAPAQAQEAGTAFTYQGRLQDGAGPADGVYDLRFELYDDPTAGTLLGTDTAEDHLVSEGLFTVQLDFGEAFDGEARWLEVAVRLGDSTEPYTALSPRQELTPAPYALFASAAPWSGLTGVPTGLADGTDSPLNRSLAPVTNTLTILDDAGDQGGHTSITIGTDGLPIISYYDDDNGDLKVAHCDDVDCTGATTTTVDSDGQVGWDTSIAIGTDGLPIISYHDRDTANRKLKVAHCNDTACTEATITTLDSGGVVGRFTSITIGTDGLPIISYYDSGVLVVAHCDNVACTGATTTTPTVDSDDFGGLWTSITIGTDGLPLISYYDGATADLKVAHCDDITCTSATATALDVSPGGQTSVTIGRDGLPLISYFKNFNLMVAHCDNVACTSATTTIVDSASTWASITIGASGLGLISYYETNNDTLKVAHCGDLVCSNATTTTIDTAYTFTSIMITIGADGLPVISYYDNTNDTLKVAHCGSAFCVPNFRRR